MNRLLVVRNGQGRFFVRRALIGVCALWLSASIAALAQSTAPALKANPPFSIRATHVVGLPNTKSNCKGTLSAQDNVLRFQQSGKTVAQVDIASVRDVFLGEEEHAGRRIANEDRQGSRSVTEVAEWSVSLLTRNTTR